MLSIPRLRDHLTRPTVLVALPVLQRSRRLAALPYVESRALVAEPEGAAAEPPFHRAPKCGAPTPAVRVAPAMAIVRVVDTLQKRSLHGEIVARSRPQRQAVSALVCEPGSDPDLVRNGFLVDRVVDLLDLVDDPAIEDLGADLGDASDLDVVHSLVAVRKMYEVGHGFDLGHGRWYTRLRSAKPSGSVAVVAREGSHIDPAAVGGPFVSSLCEKKTKKKKKKKRKKKKKKKKKGKKKTKKREWKPCPTLVHFPNRRVAMDVNEIGHIAEVGTEILDGWVVDEIKQIDDTIDEKPVPYEVWVRPRLTH